MPILTKKAVKATSMIKNGQVIEAILSSFGIGILGIPSTSSSRANPVSHAIRRQRVIIPGKKAFPGGRTDFPPFYILPYTAIPLLPQCQLTLIKTKITLNSLFITRRLGRKPKGFSRNLMDSLNMRFTIGEILNNTVLA